MPDTSASDRAGTAFATELEGMVEKFRLEWDELTLATAVGCLVIEALELWFEQRMAADAEGEVGDDADAD